MARSTVMVGAVGLVLCGLLLLQNRALRQDVAALRAQVQAGSGLRGSTAGDAGAVALKDDRPRMGALATGTTSGALAPTLEGEPKEDALQRRLRRQEAFAQLLGRLPGETDDDYRARVMPLANVWIDKARTRADEMRRLVEEKAQLSAAQKQQIDDAMAPAFDEFLAYTNAAITDGQLSPYDLNVTGLLEYAGGLGPLLAQTEGSIGKVLSPEQRQIFAASGFEWGEYLWAHAPWDRVTPPPPP